MGCRVQRLPIEQDCSTTVGTRLAAVQCEVTRRSQRNHRVQRRQKEQDCSTTLGTRVVAVRCEVKRRRQRNHRVQRRLKEQDFSTTVGTRVVAVRREVTRVSRRNRVDTRVGRLAQGFWMQLLTREKSGVSLSDKYLFIGITATMLQIMFQKKAQNHRFISKKWVFLPFRLKVEKGPNSLSDSSSLSESFAVSKSRLFPLRYD